MDFPNFNALPSWLSLVNYKSTSIRGGIRVEVIRKALNNMKSGLLSWHDDAMLVKTKMVGSFLELIWKVNSSRCIFSRSLAA